MRPVIYAKQFAEVGRRLRDLGVRDGDPQFKSKFQNAFQSVIGGGHTANAAMMEIDLPDLDDDVQVEIVQENVKAMSALYYAAQLEELKFFDVADLITEQFRDGLVPIFRSQGGQHIHRYWKDSPDRMTSYQRRALYARSFGFAQGSVDEPLPNRQFRRALDSLPVRGESLQS